MSLSSKLCGVKKKRHSYNFSFRVLPLNQPQNIPIGSTLIQYGGVKQKNVAVSFFFDIAILQKKFLRFDPTLGSNNYRLTNYNIKNHHIFRNGRTSAFIAWHTHGMAYPGYLVIFLQQRKKRLRLHSFGPLWTISTGNQWEISEFGRLSCFSDFFV